VVGKLDPETHKSDLVLQLELERLHALFFSFLFFSKTIKNQKFLKKESKYQHKSQSHYIGFIQAMMPLKFQNMLFQR